MSNLVFKSECLNAVMEGSSDASAGDVTRLACENLSVPFGDAGSPDAAAEAAAEAAARSPLRDTACEMFEAARSLQERHKSRVVTFSKKAFLNVVNLCRDICSYCTYKAEPGQASKAVMMSRQQIDDSLSMARRYGCIEALLVTGERPEERYAEARDWLAANGFSSTAECLEYASRRALDEGMLPHTNAGNLRPSELALLQETNVSMGLMLETASERLSEPGMPHHLAPSKRPAERIAVLREAGRLGIPMTTGLLLGIGETIRETVRSLDAIRSIHNEYGHIQEVILQNFWPKIDTAMRNVPPAGEAYFMTMVAACRIMMPGVNIQIPPNLSPGSYRKFLSVGINDWGGVSPLTPDFVNPEFPWPAISQIRRHTEEAGRTLECRFPVYPEFAHMVPSRLRDAMSGMAQPDGTMLVSREIWR